VENRGLEGACGTKIAGLEKCGTVKCGTTTAGVENATTVHGKCETKMQSWKMRGTDGTT